MEGCMVNKIIEEVLKGEKYIQGINAVPVYIAAGPESGNFGCKKYLGYNYSKFIMDFKNDYCDLYYDKEDLNHMFNEFLKRYKKDKKYLAWAYKKSKELEKQVIGFINKKIKEIPETTNDLLLEYYKKLLFIFYDSFGISHLVEAIALSTDSLIKDSILKELDKKGLSSKFTEYFTKLTQTTRNFFFSDFNRNMKQMVDLVKAGKDYDSKELNVLVEKHIKRFFWIRSRWDVGKEYSKQDVIDEIKERIDKNEKIEITTDENLRHNKKIKKELIKELNLDNNLVDIIELVDFVTFWQDERKGYMLTGCWALEKFVQEIAKRFGVDPNNLKYLMDYEINEDSIKSADLIKRRKGSAYLYLNDERAIVVDKDYLYLKGKLKKEEKDISLKEFSGICASIGKVIGKAKICLNEKDISKVEEGDILITSMTRPEFVPAMKKAAAIVTDEGGITCHAAVISRELKKPCIIATKIATKALKDDELIEVNANHGLIKILR
jgi:phosphohistidine swiveling domain-containing protein